MDAGPRHDDARAGTGRGGERGDVSLRVHGGDVRRPARDREQAAGEPAAVEPLRELAVARLRLRPHRLGERVDRGGGARRRDDAERVEHLQPVADQHPTRRRRRVREEPVPPERDVDGAPPDDPVRREVLRGDRPAALADVADDRGGELAAVEVARPSLRQELDRVGEPGQAEALAGAEPALAAVELAPLDVLLDEDRRVEVGMQPIHALHQLPDGVDDGAELDANRAILPRGFDDDGKLQVVGKIKSSAIALGERGRVDAMEGEDLLGERLVLGQGQPDRWRAGVALAEELEQRGDILLLLVDPGDRLADVEDRIAAVLGKRTGQRRRVRRRRKPPHLMAPLGEHALDLLRNQGLQLLAALLRLLLMPVLDGIVEDRDFALFHAAPTYLMTKSPL